ncbi:hypothetical protein HAX54_043976 [Datura stramonium]|uniref:Fatty acyl-CoA reductase n=1 Tax=Datura stramonium TaxID=4076 RepID=A0ABS8W6E0_DATST|nr:hypothetical protein [Datura stramonium]
MEDQFLQGKTILITGITGFLAKILTEKILRVLPNVKKLYLLIRATDSNSAKERFNNEVLPNYVLLVNGRVRIFGVLTAGYKNGFVRSSKGEVGCQPTGLYRRQGFPCSWGYSL